MASAKMFRRAQIVAAVLTCISFVSILLLWQSNIHYHGSSSSPWADNLRSLHYPVQMHELHQTPVFNMSFPELHQTRVFNMSFPGYTTVCNDTIPPPYDGSEKLVNVTYRACCEGPGTVGSDGQRHVCRIARKQLQIPAANEQAIRSSGAKAIDVNLIDFVHMLVFVTGASTDHFSESLIQLNSMQKFFPCTRVLYWDLGLEPDHVKQLQTFCGVEYRRFNFSKYPPHVATLKTYAFKPMVLMESFMEHPVLWWMDTSIRFKSDGWRNVVPLVKQRHGIVFFRDYEHSIYSATYPQTYEYLGTDVEMLKRLLTISGGNYIVSNTPELFSTVLYWFYACALDVHCIAPIMYPEECFLRGLADFARCHRFDQSILTIIASNVWGFDSEGYRYRGDFFSIQRDKNGDNSVKRCSLSDFESSLRNDTCRAF